MARSGRGSRAKRTRPRTPTQLYGRCFAAWFANILGGFAKLPKSAVKSAASVGNGVTVAQQTLTLFVLVRIQVPQPNLTFRRFCALARSDIGNGSRDFRKHFKWLAEIPRPLCRPPKSSS